MRRLLPLLLVCKLSCTVEEPTTTVELALSRVPAEVRSITVVVRRGDERVASATVAPERASIALGVPAEIPLEFTVLARTSRPGPAGIGAMPSHVGRLVRAIPLSAEPTVVRVTLGPAGVLTVLHPSGEAERGRVQIGAEELPAEVIRLRVRDEGFSASYVLRAGRYSAISEDEELRVDAPGAIHVAREAETVFVLRLEPAFTEPAALSLGVPDRVVDRAELTLTATDADGEPIADDEAELAWRVDSQPVQGALSDPAMAREGTILGLPAAPIPLVASASARAWVMATARLSSGEPLAASKVVEVRSSTAGPPAALVLRVADPSALRTGTELLVELVDANGAYALGSTVALDLSASDPWLDLGGPPLARIDARDRGRLLRRISAASGVLERPRRLVVSASSTVSGFVATATVTLPPYAAVQR